MSLLAHFLRGSKISCLLTSNLGRRFLPACISIYILSLSISDSIWKLPIPPFIFPEYSLWHLKIFINWPIYMHRTSKYRVVAKKLSFYFLNLLRKNIKQLLELIVHGLRKKIKHSMIHFGEKFPLASQPKRPFLNIPTARKSIKFTGSQR